jgi:hypothetical protein
MGIKEGKPIFLRLRPFVQVSQANVSNATSAVKMIWRAIIRPARKLDVFHGYYCL